MSERSAALLPLQADDAGDDLILSVAGQPYVVRIVSRPAGDIKISCNGSAEARGLRLSIALANEGPAPVRLSTVSLECPLMPLLGGDLRALRIAYCGAHSRSELSRSFVGRVNGGAPLTSWWVSAIVGNSGRGMVVGALDFRSFLTSVRVDAHAASATVHLEGVALNPGAVLTLPPLWMAITEGRPFEALEIFAELVGGLHGFAPKRAISGWGSWGHFLERIDAGVMRETALAINGSPGLRDVIDVMQIDDGWSEMLDSGRVSASWRPNRRFESGIAPLATEITREGRDCGLWILPFTVNAGSALAESHPEQLVRTESGRPFPIAGADSFCVDPTHPGGASWLRDVFAQIRGWGVRYIKLDYLRGLLSPDPDSSADGLDVPRLYHEPQSRAAAYRRGLEVLRDAAGPDAYLVGCSAPLGAGAGLLDAQRIGPDIEPAWHGRYAGIRDATMSLAANWFWNSRAWANDPDYLITTTSESESRFWATAVALSGGSIVISADLPTMQPWQERLFSLVTPPTGRSARPLDLFDSLDGPRLWRLDDNGASGDWTILGLFNWQEQPIEVVLDFAELGLPERAHVWNVWRARHKLATGRFVIPLDRHDAALLVMRPDLSRPQVVGSDVHFAPFSFLTGERWDADASRLHVQVAERLPRLGRVYVSSPGSSELREISLAPATSLSLEFLQSSRRARS